jgi:pimeloyl-ACP methyl ester carboxylesterase
VTPLFPKPDELGSDMWLLPLMFSPSKESQAAGRAYLDRIRARTEDRDALVSAETIAAYSAAIREWTAPPPSFDYLSGIAQPALVVNGNNDIVLPTINSYNLSQHLPEAELMLLPDANHGAHFQYVGRFVRRVFDFLDLQPLDVVAAPRVS